MEEKKPKKKRVLDRYQKMDEADKENPIGQALKNKGGRPKIECTPELTDRICFLIESNSKGIKQICRENPDIPHPDTIFQWIAHNKVFSERYSEAKQKQVTSHIEETYEIADDISRDFMEAHDGSQRINTECVARSKIRIELRKWHAARLAPKVYGDRMYQETTNVDAENLIKTVADLQAEIDRLKKFERDY